MLFLTEFAVRLAAGTMYSIVISALTFALAMLVVTPVPWLRRSRTFWTLALLCCAAPLLSSLGVPSAASQYERRAAIVRIEVDREVSPALSSRVPDSWDRLESVSQVWLLICVVAILLGSAVRIRGISRLNRILAAATPCDPGDFPEVDSELAACAVSRRISVLISADVSSPFVARVFDPILVLPAGLKDLLDGNQLRMAVSHEFAHLVARDPLLMSVSRWLCVLLWFNPFVPLLARRLRLAAEFDCDERALAASGSNRREYAKALLTVSRWQPHKMALPGVGESASLVRWQKSELEKRVRQIAAPIELPRRLSRWRSVLVLTAAVCVTAIFAFRPQVLAAGTTAADWHRPLSVPWRVSSAFGARGSPGEGRFHSGVDIVAPFGSNVLAVEAGIVAAVSNTADTGYGISLLLKHENGLQTRYANLQSSLVRPGQRVQKGSVIALLGSSGNSTGPHLHFEVLRNDQPVDPANILAPGRTEGIAVSRPRSP